VQLTGEPHWPFAVHVCWAPLVHWVELGAQTPLQLPLLHT
jgi:hypothetical protein